MSSTQKPTHQPQKPNEKVSIAGQIRELFFKGTSSRDIAFALGIEPKRVTQIIAREGLRRREVYEGEIRAGDKFQSPRDSVVLFVWGWHPSGKIELRTYLRPSNEDIPVQFATVTQLRSEWELVELNSAGTLIAPKIPQEIAA